MAKTSPAGSGPGRGTPRSRTTARQEQRAHRERSTSTVENEPEHPAHPTTTSASMMRARGITWRLVVLTAAVLGTMILLGQSLRIYFIQAGQIAEERERIAVTKKTIAQQKDEVERWSDPEYVRAQARVRLGWVMPGETGYRVIGPNGEPVDGSETVGSLVEASKGPWYEQMWTSVRVADAPAEDPDSKRLVDDDRVIGLEPEGESPKPSSKPS
ncbi:septum formation initiator family protein [uncultured Tessaracoccus sp.]|uniref:FtsB family cell division protein n=1 Tax=uncultured Tessaracoccus sp. TaxID=905023 RepID=UPI00261F5955|nr:septum formation initiator family protein [uncultured Tessaracoccus sp.]